MTDNPKREKLEAEARDIAWAHRSCESNCTLSAEIADWAERREREAVAERDAHWTKQEMGVASKCDEHCQRAVAEERRALQEKIDFYKSDKKSDCDTWTLELLTTFLLNRAALAAREKA